MLQQALTIAAENGHQIDLVAAYPLFVLVGAGLLALIIKMILRERAGRATLVIIMLGLTGAALMAWLYLSPEPDDWHPLMGLLQLDPLGALAQMALFGGATVLLLISLPKLSVMGQRSADFMIVMAFAVSGLAIIVISIDFLTLFTGISLVLICHFIMLGMQPRDPLGTEAGLKLFVTSLVVTSLFLFGAALIYAASGDTQFDGVTDGLFHLGQAQRGTMILGLALLVAGTAWLLGLAPLHMHVPDLYQAAPAPTAPYIAALPPVATIVVLVRLVGNPLNAGGDILRPMLLTLAIVTIIAGALLSWAQRSPRRAAGYVSMVIVGALLLPLMILSTQANITIADASIIAMTLVLSVTLLMAMGILSGMLGRLSDDPSTPPDLQTAASRIVAGGMAFFITLMLMGFALALVINAEDSGQAAWYWLIAGAATVAAARMALIFATFGLRMPRVLNAERQAVGAMWLLAALALIIAPVIWALFNQQMLAQLMHDSLQGGM